MAWLITPILRNVKNLGLMCLFFICLFIIALAHISQPKVSSHHYLQKQFICLKNAIILYFRELMELYPDAKVILTVRDPETWYKSVKETIYQINLDANSFPGSLMCRIFGRSKFFEMIQNLARRKMNRFNDGMYLQWLVIL